MGSVYLRIVVIAVKATEIYSESERTRANGTGLVPRLWNNDNKHKNTAQVMSIFSLKRNYATTVDGEHHAEWLIIKNKTIKYLQNK